MWGEIMLAQTFALGVIVDGGDKRIKTHLHVMDQDRILDLDSAEPHIPQSLMYHQRCKGVIPFQGSDYVLELWIVTGKNIWLVPDMLELVLIF